MHDEDALARIDTSVAHSARRYDYWLGGKDNFAADRASGDAYAAAAPHVRAWARENRGFMRRAVAHLAREHGIRQFLDIGTGIPTSPNLHEVVQAIAPESRVVYVDNDPIVLAHARALLAGTPQGRIAYLDADLGDPASILNAPETQHVLDFSQPIALSLVAVAHFFKDSQNAHGLVAHLVDALPPGSYLTMSHYSWDYVSAGRQAQMQTAVDAEGQPRSKAEFAQFFTGLDLIAPGITLISDWHRDDTDDPMPDAQDISTYAAVGRKPLHTA